MSSVPDKSPSTGAIPLHFSTVDLVRLVASTLEPLEREAAAHDVTLTMDGPTAALSIVGDPEKIAWAIATLVGNALRYVRRGTLRRPGGSIVVRIRSDAAEKTVTIDIEDDGPGIPAERLASLLERRPGIEHAAGLSLHLVRDVFRAHGGDLRIDSSTDHDTHGTMVHLTLPSA
jgi:two-component system sensor histidine kinase TctE